MNLLSTTLLLLLLLFSPTAVVVKHAAAQSADDQFLAAREAARAGDRARLERLAPALHGYELESYVDYWLLVPDLKDADPAPVRAFLGRHENTYIAEKLRADWLRQLARKQQWDLFDGEYSRLLQPDQELACYALQGRLARGDAKALDDAMPLWLSALEPADSCYPVFEALIIGKRVLADAVWARIRRQFEANKIAAALYTMNYLPPAQTPERKLAQTVADSPLPWLSKLPADFSGNRMQRELAALAIQRVARNEPQVAADQLERIASSLQGGEKSWAWSQIARQAAQRHMPEALQWYRQAGAVPLSDEVAEWMRLPNGRCGQHCACRTGAACARRSRACRRRWRLSRRGSTGSVAPTARVAGSTRRTRCSAGSPGSRTSTAAWPATNSVGRRRHRRKRRQPAARNWRRWLRSLACSGRRPSSA